MYQVIWNANPVGSVEMRREGMFYRFACHCRLPDKGIYRVVVTDGKNKHILGVCVPDGSRHSCIARIPCNKLNGNEFQFTLTGGDENKGIPIATGKPFSHLDKLNTARLYFANGQPEIIIAPVQGPQDNGQNPVHLNK